MSLDLRLGQVSWNSENVQNLSVLHGFITANSFPVYTKLQLLLRLANLQHKYMGLDQHFVQVLQNSMNLQYLDVLHSLLKQVRFHFYTNMQLLLHLANLPHKYIGLDQRLGQVSWNSMNVQYFFFRVNIIFINKRSIFNCFARFIKASSFPFLQRIANVPHKYMGLHQRFGQVSQNSMNVQYLAVLHGFIKESLFPFYSNLQLL